MKHLCLTTYFLRELSSRNKLCSGVDLPAAHKAVLWQAGLPRNAVFFAFVLLSFSITHAQTAWLTVESKPSGAEVYIGSMLVGTTPLQRHEVRTGKHDLRVVYPRATSWMAVSKQETIELAAEQEVRYTFELGSVLTLSSKPVGATVLLQNRELGVTPLFYRTTDPLIGTLLIRKEGYEPAAIPLAPDYPIPPRIELKPLDSDAASKLPDVLPAEYRDGSPPRWMSYAAASTMILSGVLSAYWKDQANHDFDRYTATKDPALLASTKRLDNRSGVAITISHLSFAFLAYLLLSD